MKKATRRWLFAFIRRGITCLQRQQQERQQMRQQQEPKLQQREQRLEQQELLFYRKQREQQQPGGSPTGAIFSCQFSLKGGGKTIFENCHGFHHDRADGLEPF
jgi:formate dehydrogenase assembly factor FdhD